MGLAAPEVCQSHYFNEGQLRLGFLVLNPRRAHLPSSRGGRVKERFWQKRGHSLAQGVYLSACEYRFFWRTYSSLQNGSNITVISLGFPPLLLPPFFILLLLSFLSVIFHPVFEITWPFKGFWQSDILLLRGLPLSFIQKLILSDIIGELWKPSDDPGRLVRSVSCL